MIKKHIFEYFPNIFKEYDNHNIFKLLREYKSALYL